MNEFESLQTHSPEADDTEPEPHPIDNAELKALVEDIDALWTANADALRARDNETLAKTKEILYERYDQLEAHRDFLAGVRAIAYIDPDVLDKANDELDFSGQNLDKVLK